MSFCNSRVQIPSWQEPEPRGLALCGESKLAHTDTEPKGWMRHEWKLGALRLEGNVVGSGS